uniref:RWD domain-containing protein n=1 Tax=Romanomermis culicivorax TaxID=13658 RepID=A0A915JF53_ROMCU
MKETRVWYAEKFLDRVKTALSLTINRLRETIQHFLEQKKSYCIGKTISCRRASFERQMNREEQDNEVQVLQALYVDDFIDLRTKDAWKVWRPPEFFITLHPSNTESSANSGEVSIDLHVKLTNEYPHKPPCINFAQPRQVSDKHVALLSKRIDLLAQSLVGQVMIMEICQSVQEFLRDMVNERKKSDLRFKSFHEGMLTHQKEQETIIKDSLEKQKAAQLQQQNTDWQQIEQEIKRREEEKRQALLKRKQSESGTNVRDAVNAAENSVNLRSPQSKVQDQLRTIRGSSVPADRNSTKSLQHIAFEKIFKRLIALELLRNINLYKLILKN